MSTSTLTDQVVADLQAVAGFLATMKNASNYESVREGQVLAMIQRVQGMKLRPQDGTALLNAWQQGPWTETQSQRFSEAVAGIVANQSNAATEKRGMQHLSSFEHFLSVKDIEILGGPSNNTLKLECLASRCCRLRLVCPTEPSVRAILAAGVAHGAQLGSPSESYAHTVTFKKTLKQKAKKVSKAGIHLLHYPGSIDELPAELRSEAYDAEDPPCPVQNLSPANVHKASSELVIRGSDKRVRGSAMAMGGFGSMMQLQQPFSNPMQMGGMPDPASGMTMMGWIRGMQAMQQMMQTAQNPDGMLQNLHIFKPTGSQSSSMGQVQQQASASASGQVAQQPSALASGLPSASATAQASEQLVSASASANAVPASASQGAAFIQTELVEDENVIEQATKVSDALDKKKGENNRASKSFKEVPSIQAKSKGKGKNKGKGQGKGQLKSILKNGQQKAGKPMKKPAAIAVAKAKAATAAKTPATGTREYYAQLPLKRKLQLRPHGCSKCRWSPGCRPCCYVK